MGLGRRGVVGGYRQPKPRIPHIDLRADHQWYGITRIHRASVRFSGRYDLGTRDKRILKSL